MIEVEKKFRLNPEQEKKLTEGATLDYEKTNVDEYYDNPSFNLTRNDHWLRKRNGKWEYKIRTHELGHKLGTTSYEELEDDKKIAERLGLSGIKTLDEEIAEAGYQPFARLEKTRKSYLRDGYRIDLDQCDFDYAVAEIELLVADESMQKAAADQIESFAKSIGLDQTPIHGKVIEYLRRFAPDHYQALIDAGVIF